MLFCFSTIKSQNLLLSVCRKVLTISVQLTSLKSRLPFKRRLNMLSLAEVVFVYFSSLILMIATLVAWRVLKNYIKCKK